MMTSRQIKLNGRSGLYFTIDEEDYDSVIQFKWYLLKGSNTNYARRNIRREDNSLSQQLLHTFLTGYSRTDHINYNGLDCRRSNMRKVSDSQNQFNKRIQVGGTSKHKGVHWHKASQKWFAQIKADGKHYYLGLFVDEIEAAKAWDSKAKVLHGKYAVLNFPE